ncbi:hypothetical protein PHYPO_G00222860 [Pangasianodon hypophthalmus]|uniref:Uncharacterized protein n=1 Tax=Pangasianodon hypophthalmus TaxID=310915 RepID=A0A5N5NVN3_PANHP|nr:hypothetical protein PHYPO_G00222860 [Pangasianodon hypophthalmus]
MVKPVGVYRSVCEKQTPTFPTRMTGFPYQMGSCGLLMKLQDNSPRHAQTIFAVGDTKKMRACQSLCANTDAYTSPQPREHTPRHRRIY